MLKGNVSLMITNEEAPVIEVRQKIEGFIAESGRGLMLDLAEGLDIAEGDVITMVIRL